ncbi:ATP-binding cassette domain-containing protein [Candidatus Neomarinimicrobiota bacterium]
MAAKINLDQLPAGHYHVVPDGADTYTHLARAIEEIGLDCLFMPPIVTDYLVSDSVLREAAFDLENRGMTGAELDHKARQIYRSGYFEQLLEQSPNTLSVGEQQLLAATLALNQTHPLIVGQYCFDFLSEANLRLIEGEILASGMVFIDITQRNHGQRWKLNQLMLIELEDGDLPAAQPFPQPDTQPAWILSFQNVSKSYESSNFQLQLDNKSIDVNGVLGIVGGNGSGKSTLGRCIAGLLDYTGIIETHLPAVRGKRVGYLIQQAATPTHGLALDELIGRFAWESRITAEREQELLLTLQDSEIYQKLRESDAAMGYRLAIAAILLAGDYELVILDEPTYGLPSQPTADFINIIHRQFGTVPLILISHDSNFLSGLCNTFLKLEQGSIDG